MYGDRVKQEMDNLVDRYGYFATFPNGELVGRSSEAIENMAVFPKTGKAEQFEKATRKLNLYLKREKKKIDGEERECFTFESHNLPDFKQLIRTVVKSRDVTEKE